MSVSIRMILHRLSLAAALLAAGALGYCLHPSGDVAPVSKTEVAEKQPACAIPDVGEAAKVSALRAQVQELETRLADSRKSEEAAVSNAIARVTQQHFDRPPPPGGPRERLEELKKRDPQRFMQMTNRLAKMHQERKRRQEARASFLSSVNTANMSAQDKETHDEYQELLARREALEEQIHQPDLTDDARHELMGEMREIDHQMRTLGESERKVLLNEVAQAIGMQGDAAAELVETVGEVFSATEAGCGGPPGPPPPNAMP